MSASHPSDSGPRGRTRTAILDAAMTVLATEPTASLAEVAAAADVGRSTLHRYFPERSDLVRALAMHVHALSNAAIERAELDCGLPVDALRRVIEGQLDLGRIVNYVYSDPTIAADPELRVHLDGGDEAIVEMLDRLSVAGPDGPKSWPRRVFWALLQAGFEAIRDGVPRVQVVDAIMASLTHGTIDANQEQ
ncbi:MAG: TetR/AcrR family transcriptional regulator [Mycobacterium sp.]